MINYIIAASAIIIVAVTIKRGLLRLKRGESGCDSCNGCAGRTSCEVDKKLNMGKVK